MAYTAAYATTWSRETLADIGEIQRTLGDIWKTNEIDTLPAFGADMREQLFSFDPKVSYLNHGGYGCTPKHIRQVQQYYHSRCDAEPTRWFERELQPLMTYGLCLLSRIINSPSPADIGLVANATTASNAVIRGLRLSAGDCLLTSSIAYPAVKTTLALYCKQHDVTVISIPIEFPLSSYDDFLRDVRSALSDNRDKIKFAIFDHISSGPGAILPAKELSALCHEFNVPVMIDGAHAPSQIDIDVQDIGCDWYSGNLHKWTWTPQSCAFLYTSESKQSTTHPAVVSYAYGAGYAAEFLWQGTLDYTPMACIPAALAFREQLRSNGSDQYVKQLLQSAVELLLEKWEGCTRIVPPEHNGFMCAVTLPLTSWKLEHGHALRDILLYEYGIEIPTFPVGNLLVVRLGAQVHNDISQYERVAEAILQIKDRYPDGPPLNKRWAPSPLLGSHC